MKKGTKKLLAVVLLGIMMFCLTACGVDMSKVKGDWTVKTIDGKDVKTYYQEKNLLLAINLNITDKEIKSDTLLVDGSTQSKTYTLVQRSNGVEGKEGDKVFWGLVLDDKANTLTHTDPDGVKIVFEKKKGDLSAAYADIFGASDEEYSEEEYSEEEE